MEPHSHDTRDTNASGDLVAEVLGLLEVRGVLLESARGPIDNVCELIAGESIRGSWWGHPKGHEIYAALETICASKDVARTRLLSGKVTLVHRRLWPALVCLADQFDPCRLALIENVHTPTGAHRRVETPFVEAMTPAILEVAHSLSTNDAVAMLPACIRPQG